MPLKLLDSPYLLSREFEISARSLHYFHEFFQELAFTLVTLLVGLLVAKCQDFVSLVKPLIWHQGSIEVLFIDKRCIAKLTLDGVSVILSPCFTVSP